MIIQIPSKQLSEELLLNILEDHTRSPFLLAQVVSEQKNTWAEPLDQVGKIPTIHKLKLKPALNGFASIKDH